MRKTFSKILLVSLALMAQAAVASVSLTSSRAAIGPGFLVDWGAIGGEGTQTGAPPTPVGGINLSGAPTFTVLSGGTFNADFLAGDNILALYDFAGVGDVINGQFTIEFASGVRGAGAQVQANLFGAFSGLIEAFDASNNLLGSAAVNGSNGGNGDGSAVFAGLVSDSFDIRRLTFSGFGAGAAINQLSVWSIDDSQRVPEPPALLALLGYLGLMAGARLRRPH